MRRIFTFAGLALAAAFSQAAEYTFTPLPDTNTGQIRVKLDKGTAKEFRVAAWCPGDYQIFNYGNNVTAIRFLKAGQAVTATKRSDPNLWTIAEGADEVIYEMKPSRGNFTVNLSVKANEAFVSPSAVFGWFTGHTKEQHTLIVQTSSAEFKVECPLPKAKSQNERLHRFTAKDLDELLDSPFVLSKNLQVKDYKVRGKDHAIVTFGNNSGVDLDSFAKNAQLAAEESYKLFGELPYSRYVYFFDFGGGGGGLEHMSSTRIGAFSRNGASSAGIMFHEYFHAFNVKRIRPKVLGPFDYSKPAITPSIWWLEGVTDYYAEVLQVRSGLQDRNSFLRDMWETLSSLAGNSASERVSAEESSRRVWESRGSGGYGGINYYVKGRAIGFLLDVAIRAQTKNKHSLDDVIRQLYEECKNGQPGYEESRIRELCVKFGGAELGPIYDDCVVKAQHLPAARVLAMGGLVLTDSGIADDSNNPGALGPTFPFDLRGKSVSLP
ncbi:MAG: M61 family metallopeptidase [Fimbriimonadaceae bacterium]|nr:M61 family metallopeptidase [Fimbriimonadaceae bacterium]